MGVIKEFEDNGFIDRLYETLGINSESASEKYRASECPEFFSTAETPGRHWYLITKRSGILILH